jgi:hypothetical protein
MTEPVIPGIEVTEHFGDSALRGFEKPAPAAAGVLVTADRPLAPQSPTDVQEHRPDDSAQISSQVVAPEPIDLPLTRSQAIELWQRMFAQSRQAADRGR